MELTDNQKVLAWLGQWRDKIPPQAVSDLQDIVGTKQKKDFRKLNKILYE